MAKVKFSYWWVLGGFAVALLLLRACNAFFLSQSKPVKYVQQVELGQVLAQPASYAGDTVFVRGVVTCSDSLTSLQLFGGAPAATPYGLRVVGPDTPHEPLCPKHSGKGMTLVGIVSLADSVAPHYPAGIRLIRAFAIQ